MRIVTWNLDGLDPRRIDERTEAAVATLLADPPDVVFLQEVVRRTWFAHLRPHLTNAGYTAAIVVPHEHGYVEALFSRLPLVGAERHPLVDSEQGRFLMVADAVWGERPVRLATAHLESGVAAAPTRRRQLAQVVDLLSDGPVVFGGDTNLRDADVAAVPAIARFTDAWAAAGSPATGRYTWDTRRCPNRDLRGPRARFDRFYLSPDLEVRSVGVLGEAVVAGTGLWPSDHSALSVEVRWRESPERA